MSKNGEFNHGTGHKFGVTREFPGSYKSCCGMTIESHPVDKQRWLVTWPGQYQPDHDTRTLQEAKSVAEQHHGEPK